MSGNDGQLARDATIGTQKLNSVGRRWLSHEQRTALSQQGVLFDTGDESNSDFKLTLENLKRLKEGKLCREDKMTLDGTDTGLGTVSLDENTEDDDISNDPNNYDLNNVNRKEIASRVDARFNELMAELAPQTADDVTYQKRSVKLTRADSQTDLDSIRTEDMEREFSKSLILPQAVVSAKLPSPVHPAASMGRDFRRVRGSDLDSVVSVRTEDFERRFSSLVVKPPQTDIVPARSQPSGMSANIARHMDSDLDTRENQHIVSKYRSTINKPIENKLRHVDGDSENLSTEDDDDDERDDEAEDEEDGYFDNVPVQSESIPNMKYRQELTKSPQNMKRSSPTRMSLPATQLQEQNLEQLRQQQLLRDYQQLLNHKKQAAEQLLQQQAQTRSNGRRRRRNSGERAKSATPTRSFDQKSERSSKLKRQGSSDFDIDRMESAARFSSDRLDADRLQLLRSAIQCDAERLYRDTLQKISQTKPSNNMPARSSPYTDLSSSGAMEKNLTVSNKVDYEVSKKLEQELLKLQAGIKHSLHAKQALNKELNQVKSLLTERKREMSMIEKETKENRKMAEDARSSLMLAEFEKETKSKELERLTIELHRQRAVLDRLEFSSKKLQEIGYTTEEVTKLVSERELWREFEKKSEAVERENAECVRQLNAANESLFTEMKKCRELEATLNEERQQKESTIEELGRQKDQLMNKLSRTESKCQQLEHEKSEFIKEKSREYSNFRSKMSEELAACKENGAREMSEMHAHNHELEEQLKTAKSDSHKFEQEIKDCREQLTNLSRELTSQSELRDSLIQENMKSLKIIVREKELALATMRVQASEEQRQALEALSRENEQAMKQMENNFNQQLATCQSQLTSRTTELQSLKERECERETWMKQAIDRIQDDTHQKFQKLISEEREKWEIKKEEELVLQMQMMREEMERGTRLLREELEHERFLAQTYNRQIISLREEIDAEKEKSRHAAREKQQLITELKESTELDKQRQLDALREKIEQETHRVMESLRDTVRRQEEELERLRMEKKEIQAQEHDQCSVMEKFEQNMADELNQEYQKMAALVNRTVRTVNPTSYAWSSYKVNTNRVGARPALIGTMTSLKSINDEVREHLTQLRLELETQKQENAKIEKAMRSEIEAIKTKLQSEKLEALETLKERLIKEHVDEAEKLNRYFGERETRSQQEWDTERQEAKRAQIEWQNQITDKLARQISQQMKLALDKRTKEHKQRQMEWEREKAAHQRERDFFNRSTKSNGCETAVVRSTSPLRVSYVDPALVTNTGRESADAAVSLQMKMKRLQLENECFRRDKFSASVPDLNKILDGQTTRIDSKKNDPLRVTTNMDSSLQAARRVEIGVERVENKTKEAEERAAKSDRLLSQKLIEMSRLQSSFAQQSNEMLKLEKAYSKLQTRDGSSPVRHSQSIHSATA